MFGDFAGQLADHLEEGFDLVSKLRGVDLAVEAGGNCPLSEMGKTVKSGGVSIIGHANVPSRIAEDASQLFAKNLLNFITPLVDPETKSLKIDWEDEIVQGTLVCKDGKVVHPRLTGEGS